MLATLTGVGNGITGHGGVAGASRMAGQALSNDPTRPAFTLASLYLYLNGGGDDPMDSASSSSDEDEVDDDDDMDSDYALPVVGEGGKRRRR